MTAPGSEVEGAAMGLAAGIQQAAHALAEMSGDPDHEPNEHMLYGMTMALGIILDLDPDETDTALAGVAAEWYRIRDRHPFYSND